jgi:diguanylate cyclase (GGDEF)-like protein
MDIAMPVRPVEPATRHDTPAGISTVINPALASIPIPLTGTAASELPGKPRYAHQILSAIISHDTLPSIMQMIADAFVVLCPANGVAIFSLSGSQFHLEAEAGLPQRVSEGLDCASVSGSQEKPAWNSPPLGQILDCGVKLCQASPLLSASGEARGTFTVFDRQQGLLDDTTRDTIGNLSDLARLAMEHSQLYQEVLRGAQYDRLTGFPNRLVLEDRLRQAMVNAMRQGTLLGVCSIDLDRFKRINDTLGQEVGDAFFKLVSERLKLSIREVDTLARYGSDRFVLSLRDLAKTSDAANICRRLLESLRMPFVVEGHSLVITASIGISIFPDHGETADLLVRNADMALLAAKRAGGNQAQTYSRALGRTTRRASEMVDALVSAVAQSQFRMVYQPIYTMDKEIAGFEALLRWNHPTWGQINPLEFIPTAESSGLIVAIGDWVIDEVCRQAMEWNAAAVRPVKMFANVSGVQLERPDFSSKIADALERSGLAPRRLELEITESWIISDLRGAAGKLQKLRDLGIGIAIDDFGTGNATFNYLQELPLDTLKIDRSFVHRLDGSAAARSTVRAIAMLAQELGLKTVAEGVECEQQIRQLEEIGCELMQGFFLARPLEPEAACLLLSKEQQASPRLKVAKKRVPAELSPTQRLTG